MKPVFVAAFILCVTVSILCDKEKADHGHKHPDDVDGEHDASFDHDAILGSKDAEKEFAELPPEEAKARLAKIAHKMDENNDDKITHEELKKWVHNSFLKMDIEDAMKRLDEYDSDKDNYVAWKEFLQGVYGYSEEDYDRMVKDADESNKEIKDMVGEDNKKFNMADTDKDGRLSREEYATFEHPYNYPHMRSIEVDRMMKDHDKDSDGKITFDEYQTKTEDKPDTETITYEKDQFESLDKDKNAYLDRDEVVHWVAPDNDESSKEEADHLVEQADTNKDGVLTVEEIVANHELFVGSQATDYGNDLHKHIDEL